MMFKFGKHFHNPLPPASDKKFYSHPSVRPDYQPLFGKGAYPSVSVGRLRIIFLFLPLHETRKNNVRESPIAKAYFWSGRFCQNSKKSNKGVVNEDP